MNSPRTITCDQPNQSFKNQGFPVILVTRKAGLNRHQCYETICQPVVDYQDEDISDTHFEAEKSLEMPASDNCLEICRIMCIYFSYTYIYTYTYNIYIYTYNIYIYLYPYDKHMISYELFHSPLLSHFCRVQPLKGGCSFSPYPNTHHPSKDDEKGEALEAACHLMSDLAELLEGVYQGLGFFC